MKKSAKYFWKLAKELNGRWEIEGFNNHEAIALDVGYIEKYFPEYLPLKLELLNRRDSAGSSQEKRFFNALRVYVYTIYENLWYGYLISYSEWQQSSFLINGKAVNFLYPHQNHLPSFSSAILHFGTCRDLFIVLLKLYLDPQQVKNKGSIGNLIKSSYKGKNKKEEFRKDLIKLSNNSDPNYISEGLEVFEGNEFRNFFAHRLRLLWWHNKKCSLINYFIKKETFEAIKNKENNKYLRHIFDILQDSKSYRNIIEDFGCSELVSSGEILRDTHDLIANFFNKSLKFIREYLKDSETSANGG